MPLQAKALSKWTNECVYLEGKTSAGQVHKRDMLGQHFTSRAALYHERMSAGQVWWHTPLIPAWKAPSSLSWKSAGVIKWDPASKKKKWIHQVLQPLLCPLILKSRRLPMFVKHGVWWIKSFIALEWDFSHFLKTDGGHKWRELIISWSREHLAYPEGGRENCNVTLAYITINKRGQGCTGPARSNQLSEDSEGY